MAPTVAPILRPMLPADVEPATEMILSHDWGVRRAWLEFATTQPAVSPMVAEVDGEIVGTGVGLVSGLAGWLGTIFIAPAWRGHGLGWAMTQSIIDRLEAAGCRTLVLVATAEGRRLYERMGFAVQTTYRILEIRGLAAGGGAAGQAGPATSLAVRPFDPSDLDAICALDRLATGENRASAIRTFANPGSAKVATDGDGAVAGFVIRAPWGGGATIASSTDIALRILEARRLASGPEGRVRVGLLADNGAGHDRLVELGMRPSWTAPRMIRGEPLEWRPDWIWGQFNHAMG